jgi:hypothetical protein
MAEIKVGQIYEDQYMIAKVIAINANSIRCKVFNRQTQRTRERDLEKAKLLEMAKI